MSWITHTVSNQPPELGDCNLFDTDIALVEGVRREGADARAASALSAYGEALGRRECLELAHQANRCGPELEAYDRQGRRVDRVHFHPAWHHFMAMAFGQGMHCSAWSGPGPGAQVARAAAYLVHGQVEAGSLCPTTMTSAAIPVLRGEPIFDTLRGFLYSRHFDGRDMPLKDKLSMTIGMGMTEKQSGSDLRANTTRATPLATGGRGGHYRITGHKWFFSAPTSDAHLVLARTADGEEGCFSCFFVPRWVDGERNAIHLQRLKDKLGNRSNASAEAEFQDALGVLVGEPGKGIATLVRMASYTRLDCVLGSAALLRQALVQALHHARHRTAFGKPLADQPLMQAVLADLALESEAATVLALRLARAFDSEAAAAARTEEDEGLVDLALRRILTPAAKFWICKRAVGGMAECMEVLGGNGYIENGPLARLYREAPVNAIWEGSGNIMCLDVLRACAREPHAVRALMGLLDRVFTQRPALRERLRPLTAHLVRGGDISRDARAIAQELVLLTQASLLMQHAPALVADAFIDTRFDRMGGLFGTAPCDNESARALIARAWPQ